MKLWWALLLCIWCCVRFQHDSGSFNVGSSRPSGNGAGHISSRWNLLFRNSLICTSYIWRCKILWTYSLTLIALGTNNCTHYAHSVTIVWCLYKNTLTDHSDFDQEIYTNNVNYTNSIKRFTLFQYKEHIDYVKESKTGSYEKLREKLYIKRGVSGFGKLEKKYI